MHKDKNSRLERINNPDSKADAKVLIEENKFKNFRDRLKIALRKGERIEESNSARIEKTRKSR